VYNLNIVISLSNNRIVHVMNMLVIL